MLRGQADANSRARPPPLSTTAVAQGLPKAEQQFPQLVSPLTAPANVRTVALPLAHSRVVRLEGGVASPGGTRQRQPVAAELTPTTHTHTRKSVRASAAAPPRVAGGSRSRSRTSSAGATQHDDKAHPLGGHRGGEREPSADLHPRARSGSSSSFGGKSAGHSAAFSVGFDVRRAGADDTAGGTRGREASSGAGWAGSAGSITLSKTRWRCVQPWRRRSVPRPPPHGSCGRSVLPHAPDACTLLPHPPNPPHLCAGHPARHMARPHTSLASHFGRRGGGKGPRQGKPGMPGSPKPKPGKSTPLGSPKPKRGSSSVETVCTSLGLLACRAVPCP